MPTESLGFYGRIYPQFSLDWDISLKDASRIYTNPEPAPLEIT